MKKYIKSLLLLFFSFLFYSFLSSCSSDDDITPQEESVRYYVKYEVSIYTWHTNINRTITFTDEKGTQTLVNKDNVREINWEGTYGPVDKNFVASLHCETAQLDDTAIHARIYVSREKEPFVIKAEGTNNKNSKELSLTYKIDF